MTSEQRKCMAPDEDRSRGIRRRAVAGLHYLIESRPLEGRRRWKQRRKNEASRSVDRERD